MPIASVYDRPRRTVVKIHRWLSIIVLPWIAVIAITGGVLVFDDGLNVVPTGALRPRAG